MTSEEKQQRFIKVSQEVSYQCKKFRQDVLKISVRDLANLTGYSTNDIYSFESNRTRNLVILFDCYLMPADIDQQLQLLRKIRKGANVND